jgi:hypothetical protein
MSPLKRENKNKRLSVRLDISFFSDKIVSSLFEVFKSFIAIGYGDLKLPSER